MKVILDTSFVVSCVRDRIDFISQLEAQGFEPVVPREVLQELKDLITKEKMSHDGRVAVGVALEILGKKRIKKMKLGGKTVDAGLIEKGRQGYHIATLDKEIKHSVPKKIVIFSAEKKVGVG